MGHQAAEFRLSELVLRAMMRRGFDRDRLSVLIGKPAAFVDSVINGKERLRPQQLRRLEAAAGLSVERLALLGIERTGITEAQARFLQDTERLVDVLESA